VIEIGGVMTGATCRWATEGRATGVMRIWEMAVLGTVGRRPGGPAGAGCAIALLA
jgi:hypothetical protein